MSRQGAKGMGVGGLDRVGVGRSWAFVYDCTGFVAYVRALIDDKTAFVAYLRAFIDDKTAFVTLVRAFIGDGTAFVTQPAAPVPDKRVHQPQIPRRPGALAALPL